MSVYCALGRELIPEIFFDHTDYPNLFQRNGLWKALSVSRRKSKLLGIKKGVLREIAFIIAHVSYSEKSPNPSGFGVFLEMVNAVFVCRFLQGEN